MRTFLLAALVFLSGVAWERWTHNCYTELGLTTVRCYRTDQQGPLLEMDYRPAGDAQRLAKVCASYR